MTEQHTPTNIERIRKVAILVTSLDSEEAAALLDKMPRQLAQEVLQAASDLDDVTTAERDAVVADFLGSRPTEPPADPGVELDPSLAQRLNEEPVDLARDADPEPRPFSFLHDANAESLARHLQRENAQVIAVVISHLSPDRAAEVVGCFDDQLQANVLGRVADLEFAPPEVLEDLERELAAVMADELRATRCREAGLSAVSSILQAAGSASEQMANNLARHDQQLADSLDLQPKPTAPSPVTPVETTAQAEEPPKRLFSSRKRSRSSARGKSAAARTASIRSLRATRKSPVQPKEAPAASDATSADATDEPSTPGPSLSFDDVQQLDDGSLARLFAATDPQVALWALVGSPPEFVSRLMIEMAPVDARKLRGRMEAVGPIQLADITRAQQQIAELASRLMIDGVIESRRPRLAVVA